MIKCKRVRAPKWVVYLYFVSNLPRILLHNRGRIKQCSPTGPPITLNILHFSKKSGHYETDLNTVFDPFAEHIPQSSCNRLYLAFSWANWLRTLLLELFG